MHKDHDTTFPTRRPRVRKAIAGGVAAAALLAVGAATAQAASAITVVGTTPVNIGGVALPNPTTTAPALAGKYVGTLAGDDTTTAGITMQVTGAPSNVSVVTSLSSGAKMECNGTQDVPALSFTLTGARTGVNADSSSTYHLTGQQSFDTSPFPGVTVHVVVNISVDGATLSADGKHFSGPANLQVQPSIGDNCTKNWSFDEQRATITVPNVVHLKAAAAQQTLLNAGLHPVLANQTDPTCNNIGSVLHTNPSAGDARPTEHDGDGLRRDPPHQDSLPLTSRTGAPAPSGAPSSRSASRQPSGILRADRGAPWSGRPGRCSKRTSGPLPGRPSAPSTKVPRSRKCVCGSMPARSRTGDAGPACRGRCPHGCDVRRSVISGSGSFDVERSLRRPGRPRQHTWADRARGCETAAYPRVSPSQNRSRISGRSPVWPLLAGRGFFSCRVWCPRR